jgi:hypothetical protein
MNCGRTENMARRGCATAEPLNQYPGTHVASLLFLLTTLEPLCAHHVIVYSAVKNKTELHNMFILVGALFVKLISENKSSRQSHHRAAEDHTETQPDSS